MAIEHILSSSSLTSGSRLPLSIISNPFLNLLKLYLGHCHSQICWKFLFQYYHMYFDLGPVQLLIPSNIRTHLGKICLPVINFRTDSKVIRKILSLLQLHLDLNNISYETDTLCLLETIRQMTAYAFTLCILKLVHILIG